MIPCHHQQQQPVVTCMMKPGLARETSTTSTEVPFFSDDQTTSMAGRSTGSSRTRLSFGSIQVREYERIISNDDSWVCIGLGLGWNYQEEDAVPVVDDYGGSDDNHSEQQRETSTSKSTTATGFWKKKKKSRRPTLSLVGMKLEPTTASQRFKILCNFGYSNKELLQSEKHRKLFHLDYSPSSNLVPLLCLKRTMKSTFRLSTNTQPKQQQQACR
jgi:hypothetical protein